VFWWNF